MIRFDAPSPKLDIPKAKAASQAHPSTPEARFEASVDRFMTSPSLENGEIGDLLKTYRALLAEHAQTAPTTTALTPTDKQSTHKHAAE